MASTSLAQQHTLIGRQAPPARQTLQRDGSSLSPVSTFMRDPVRGQLPCSAGAVDSLGGVQESRRSQSALSQTHRPPLYTLWWGGRFPSWPRPPPAGLPLFRPVGVTSSVCAHAGLASSDSVGMGACAVESGVDGFTRVRTAVHMSSISSTAPLQISSWWSVLPVLQHRDDDGHAPAHKVKRNFIHLAIGVLRKPQLGLPAPHAPARRGPAGS